MILVIGNENCSRCEITKKLLTDKNIKFDYKLFSSLDNQLEVRKMAMSNGMASFPLIMKDGELVE
jgi:glutaredoxin